MNALLPMCPPTSLYLTCTCAGVYGAPGEDGGDQPACTGLGGTDPVLATLHHTCRTDRQGDSGLASWHQLV